MPWHRRMPAYEQGFSTAVKGNGTIFFGCDPHSQIINRRPRPGGRTQRNTRFLERLVQLQSAVSPPVKQWVRHYIFTQP
jgi:hypothetical protein